MGERFPRMRKRARRALRNISKFMTKRRSIPTAELFVRQCLDPGPLDSISGASPSLGGNRLDVTVRYLAIECCFGQNSYGLDLYWKLQEGRRKVQPVPDAVERFRKLIESVQENGYDPSSEIELDSNYHLINGAHRLALALYYGVKELPCAVRPYRELHLYDVNWFAGRGFTGQEINLILRKSDELLAKALCIGEEIDFSALPSHGKP